MVACPAIPIMATTMREEGAEPVLLRLMTWLSPAFPVGAFAYSHGLERAVHDGLIHDRATLTAWLEALVQSGSAWNDAVLLAESWRSASYPGWTATAELSEAMAGSRERRMETILQGAAFVAAASAWPHPLPDEADGDISYPVAVGLAARVHGMPLQATLAAYLHAFVSSLTQAAMRLVPLGQSDGVAVIAALEPSLLAVANRASRSTPDDLGSSTFMGEIMAMKHETQYSRVFRS